MAQKFFKNATIIAFNESSKSIELHRDADLLVEGDTIAALGKDLKVPADAEVIDCTGQILSPGFINTHTHHWQSAFRSLAPNTTLAEYFSSYSQYSQAATKSFSPDDVYTSTLAGYYEGFNGGTTTFVEHAQNNWSLDVVKRGYEAAVNSGGRVWWCCAAEDREGVTAESEFEFLAECGKKQHDLVSPGLAWDYMGGTPPEQVEQVKDKIRLLNLRALTIHLLGGPWGFPDAGPSTAAKLNLQDLDIPIIWSHAGFTSTKDHDNLRKHNWFLSITPESEQHYGHGQQTSRLVQDQASLGVDTNYTFSADMMTQSRIWLQSVRNVSYNNALDKGKIPRQNPMTVEDAFLLATRQGALALRRDDIGVLKVGAKADIVCFDGGAPNMAGWTDPVAAVILHANAGDVRDVLVNGRFVKRSGELVLRDGDWESFRGRFVEIARRIHRENPEPQAYPEKFMGRGEWIVPEVMSTRAGGK